MFNVRFAAFIDEGFFCQLQALGDKELSLLELERVWWPWEPMKRLF